MQSENFHAKVWKDSLENTARENKIFNFQFGPVCTNQTCPKCSVENNQDEAEIQYDQWSAHEWCNCEKCEKMSTS